MNERPVPQQSTRANLRCLTGFSLKMIGIVLMVFDHLHQMFYMMGAPDWFQMMGRPVAPIFLFLAAEAFHYTHDRKKYLLRLLAGFWFMQVASLLLERFLPMEDVTLINSIFGTLFLAAFYMWMVDILKKGFREKSGKHIVLGIAGVLAPIAASALSILLIQVSPLATRLLYLLVPTLLTVEGGIVWVILGVGFYLAREHRFIQVVILAAISALTFFTAGGIQWMMIFAAVPILLYNGRPGRKSKWFFYIFYPAHIYLFYVISYLLH